MKLVKLQRPTLNAWPSFGRLADLRDEIDHLFDSPVTGFAPVLQTLGDWTPALDIHEDKENFVVMAELPGMREGGCGGFVPRRLPDHFRRTQG